MGLTKADAVFKHRVLWCAMAEYMSKGIVEDTIAGLKYKVLKERFSAYTMAYAMDLAHKGFLCMYKLDCNRCPLQDITVNSCLNGLDYKFFLAYHVESDYSEAVKTALKIAFLPVIN